jgi:hypothetical protein
VVQLDGKIPELERPLARGVNDAARCFFDQPGGQRPRSVEGLYEKFGFNVVAIKWVLIVVRRIV